MMPDDAIDYLQKHGVVDFLKSPKFYAYLRLYPIKSEPIKNMIVKMISEEIEKCFYAYEKTRKFIYLKCIDNLKKIFLTIQQKGTATLFDEIVYKNREKLAIMGFKKYIIQLADRIQFVFPREPSLKSRRSSLEFLNGKTRAADALRVLVEPTYDAIVYQLSILERRLFACDLIERSLPLYEKIYPNDNRLRMALEEAREVSQDYSPSVDQLSHLYAANLAVAEAERTAIDLGYHPDKDYLVYISKATRLVSEQKFRTPDLNKVRSLLSYISRNKTEDETFERFLLSRYLLREFGD